MKDFRFLKLLDLLKPTFEKLGVEYAVMRRILQIKLVMDGRRVPTILSNKNYTENNDNSLLKSLGVYLLMGLILIPFVWMKQDYFFQMSILYSILIFFLMTTLISDFSSVLLDIKDKNIIGTKPVSPRTLHTAKTIHISYYMFSITAALTGPSIFAGLYRQGILFVLIYLVSVILLDMLIIVLTSFIYLFVLKFFDGEKLKDIINYIQIILTIGITVGYQIFIRIFNYMDLEAHFTPKWWQFFLIPIWYAAPFQMLMKAEINSTYLIFTLMAVIIPITAIIIYLNIMSVFEKYLQKLNNNVETRKKKTKKPVSFVSRLICRSKEEQLFFRFAADMMKNEREFKLKVYPSLGFSIVFPYIFVFQQAADMGLKDLSQGKFYLFIYFSGLMFPTILWMIRYSSNYKGAWIYKAVPVTDNAPIFRGTIKAVIARLFFPLFFLQGLTFIAIFGIRIIPDLLLVFINTMIFNILYFMFSKKSLPFSEAFKSAQQMDGLTSIAMMMLLGALAVLHYFVSGMALGLAAYIGIAAIVFLILWQKAFQISDNSLDKN